MHVHFSIKKFWSSFALNRQMSHYRRCRIAGYAFLLHWSQYCFLWNCQTKKFGIWKSSKQWLLMSDFTLQSHLSHMVMMKSLLGKDDYGFGWWCGNYWDTLGGTELTRPRLTRGQKTNADFGKVNFGAQNLTCIGKSSRFHVQIIGMKTTFVQLYCNVSILQ